MPKVRAKVANNMWLRQREIGQKPLLGHADHFTKGLYSSILPCTSWEHGDNLTNAMHGGVFNLEFSPEGSLLVAACEKKSILMFDPLCRKLVHAVDNAHRDCVNCVRFLDSRVFATCSDDSTVALWDARNLKSQIRTLHGHSNWVKNIEFSSRDGLLVTSGFDGSIYTWDINSYTENSFVYNRVFHTNGLMRTRLNPDASKMIICTTGGYLMIVHNLDLNTLAQDLNGFKPNMYRLMQLSQTTIPLAADFTHLFSQHRKVNRIEFITDFPKGDDAEVVSSLQIHPQGWCALSRNISNDESSEWTCVHDIQELGPIEPESEDSANSDNDQRRGRDNGQESDSDSESEAPRRRRIRPSRTTAGQSASSTGRASRNGMDGISIETYRRGAFGAEVGRVALSSANVELHVSSADVWEALMAIREARVRRERERELAERVDQERDRERSERERDRLTRSVNVRIRMHNGVGGPEERRAVDESVRNNNNNTNGNNSSADEWMRGRVRILVRRNPDSSASANENSERSDSNEGGGSERPESRVPQSNSSIIRGILNHPLTRVLERARMIGPHSAPSSASGSQTPQSNSSSEPPNNSTAPPNNAAASPTVFIRSRNSSANTILIVDNRMPRTASATLISTPRSISPEPAPRRTDINPKINHKIHQNVPRLTHYIEEPNVGKGFIKELCFSADGRLICSPYGYGIRLLSFSPDCSELSVCYPQKTPVKLYEMATNVCHADIVVSSKFSPRHCLLVSGCLSGKIVWHQPVV